MVAETRWSAQRASDMAGHSLREGKGRPFLPQFSLRRLIVFHARLVPLAEKTIIERHD